MTNEIAKVYVACYRGDVRFARTCVASVRRWYPDIPIVLVKDASRGDFSTTDIERATGAKVFEEPTRRYGWGFSKLEPLFLRTDERFLMLDADTIVCGDVLRRLGRLEADFVVSGRLRSTLTERENWLLYYDEQALARIDPEFDPPDFRFNSGQFIGRSGCLARKDFAQVMDWSGSIPRSRYPDLFRTADQAVLNYVLCKQAALGRIRLATPHFQLWPREDAVLGKSLDEALSPPGEAFILHWAGIRRPLFRDMERGDVLQFYEDYYFNRLAPSVPRWFKVSQAVLWDYSLRWSVRLKIAVSRILGQGIRDRIARILGRA